MSIQPYRIACLLVRKENLKIALRKSIGLENRSKKKLDKYLKHCTMVKRTPTVSLIKDLTFTISEQKDIRKQLQFELSNISKHITRYRQWRKGKTNLTNTEILLKFSQGI